MSVTLTAAMRANLLSLQSTASLLGATQFRLATGLKVNSALDNPSSFFAAQGLTNRANDLGSLLDAMGQSVQTLKAADEGIKGLTKLVEQAKSIAQTARSTASGASGGTVTSDFIATADIADLTNDLYSDGDTIMLQAGSGAVHTITIDSTGATGPATLQDLVDTINDISGFHASIEIGTGADAGMQALTITTTNAEDLNVTETSIDTTLNIDGAYAAGSSSAAQLDLETQYNALLDQIDAFVADTGYRGVNLLNGDFMKTVFNEDGSSFQQVDGAARDSSGLGLGAADFSTSGAIDDVLGDISDALTTMRTDATKYGNALSVIQTRQDFTANLVNVLKDGATALTIADKNEEGANMLALQTSQQLGIQSLSLASQANQSVLRLFQ
jgi:flagellin-like hook-associated protein FlgL